MHKLVKLFLSSILLVIIFTGQLDAQISPGDLAEAHANLEGMSNCTQCHILGEKVSNEKCLACHTELKIRVEQNKGYHSSPEVKGNDCIKCHSDHHGRDFEMIRFDKETFNHSLTGYELLGSHKKQECKNCHKAEFISNQKIKEKKYTFLGLNTACLSCHKDIHQKTLSTDCSKCHGFEKFIPAAKFHHQDTKYPLKGAHRDVECIKCHKKEIKNGEKFQEFAGISFDNCTNCHEDIHHNQFGQNCIQCHSEESFHTIKGINQFDHSKTGYNLEGKHRKVDCKSCHKTKLTDPLKHKRCTDCHSDYHHKQFVENGVSPDCSKCHTTEGFSKFNFSIEQHNAGSFRLQGAHLATPCFSCHKKGEKWSFREIGIKCNDCHTDIHEGFLEKKYYPENDCKKCHSVDIWSDVKFDHSTTTFTLQGAHVRQSCKACHFTKGNDGKEIQKFAGLSTQCSNCHKDVHVQQFEENGITKCNKCHGFENWKINKFDHSKTRFPLDGRHINVACNKCHKPVQEGQVTYTQYKFKDIKCETCHL